MGFVRHICCYELEIVEREIISVETNVNQSRITSPIGFRFF